MFRIRKVLDDVQPVNREALLQVKELLRGSFKSLDRHYLESIQESLTNPFKYRYRSILYVAENDRNMVLGMALFYHEPVLRYCYLDYLASLKQLTGRGIGGALYQRVSDECRQLGVEGLFFEALPDDPRLCPDSSLLKQNQSRLRFYENMGARPVTGTAYETPVEEGGDNPPYLLFDDLGLGTSLRNSWFKKVVASILRRVHKGVCNSRYLRMVLDSITDDPVQVRKSRYPNETPFDLAGMSMNRQKKILLVVNPSHDILHVRERGYVEAPVRVEAILKGLRALPFFREVKARTYPDRYLLAVHSERYVSYLKKACEKSVGCGAIYPNIFPERFKTNPDGESPAHAGFYIYDSYTPIHENSFKAARAAVNCCLTAGELILEGNDLVYALVRPPGHHAEKELTGGFCYFNNGAVAAQFLCRYGKVAIVDVDYHHGNGQQTIFYSRRDVLTVSLHRHPGEAYPYFSGFREERGEGEGKGYNINVPLAGNLTGSQYLMKLRPVIQKVLRFSPSYLVVCLGFDTARGDPTGNWFLGTADFREMGALFGRLSLPTLVVQEGGYLNRSLGRNAAAFFSGLYRSHCLAGKH